MVLKHGQTRETRPRCTLRQFTSRYTTRIRDPIVDAPSQPKSFAPGTLSRTSPPPQFSDSSFPKGMSFATAPLRPGPPQYVAASILYREPPSLPRMGITAAHLLSVTGQARSRGCELVSELNPKYTFGSPNKVLRSIVIRTAFYARVTRGAGRCLPLKSGAVSLWRRHGRTGVKSSSHLRVGNRPFP